MVYLNVHLRCTCVLLQQAKHLQFVSGVNVTSFWISTFAWDLLSALVPVILSVILFAAFRVDGYTGDGLLGVFLLLVLDIEMHVCHVHLHIVYTSMPQLCFV